MNKLVWIGVAVAAVLFAAVLALYFMPKPGYDRPHYNGTSTPVPAPDAGQTQISQPPPTAVKHLFNETAGVAKPPFSASAYEVNYTFVSTVSYGGVAVTIEGWMVVGVGPAGNYSFGMITIPLVGTAAYKSATEDGATYTIRCFRGECEVEEEGSGRLPA